MKRPILITILAILAGCLAVLAGIATLRFLGFFPFLGTLNIRTFNLWYALMYGLLTWVYVWLTRALWNLEPQAWTFLIIITVFNLSMDFMILITGGEWYDVNLSVIVNSLILLIAVLPGTKRAFGLDRRTPTADLAATSTPTTTPQDKA